MNKTQPFIAVIGAGPAGLMAAAVLSAGGCAVTVFDQMPAPGRKLLMAGRGGLNLTHSEALPAFIGRYGAAQDWIAPMIHAFTPHALIAFAEALGQETFIGTSGRVFPRAMKASPLLRSLLQRLDAQGVQFALRHRWLGFGDAGGLRFATPEGERIVAADATVLALGGASWPRLGANGAWTAILREAGVRIEPFRPANAGLHISWSEDFAARFAGEPLKNIALGFQGAEARGDAIVTAHGIEGGPVYALFAAIRDALVSGPQTLFIDLRPDMDAVTLTTALTQAPRSLSLSERLRKTLNLAPVARGLLREGSEKPPADAPALARHLKAVPLCVAGTAGIERAISSAGGIARDALDDRLMLRARPGVFACGEMIDWEAPTGGYLLQGCFSTAVAAAKGVLAWTTETCNF